MARKLNALKEVSGSFDILRFEVAKQNKVFLAKIESQRPLALKLSGTREMT